MISIITAIRNQLPMNQIFYENLLCYTHGPFELIIIDNQSKAPLAATPDMFEPVADTPDRRLETVGRKNTAGPLAMATPR